MQAPTPEVERRRGSLAGNILRPKTAFKKAPNSKSLPVSLHVLILEVPLSVQ